METADTDRFHQLYGKPSRRVAYKSSDFLDYALMSLACAALVYAVYGPRNVVAWVGIAACAWMLVAFPLRHGVEWSAPLVARRPQELLYLFIYKLRNLKPLYFVAVAVLAVENLVIWLTPQWPHYVELMRKIGYGLFYLHLGAITLYRTYSLVVHLRRRELVREILLQTSWKRRIEGRNVAFEIWHAFFTGLLSHILLVAPWFLVITYCNFSVLLLPFVCAANFYVHAQFLKIINEWFYRDHWVAHNAELEFVYVHGTHHDAIPSGLIGVAGNGHIEGFLRHSIGVPAPFFNPLVATFVYSFEVHGDIEAHQFIPGMYPKANIEYQKLTQHSLHHFGMLEPYGFALNVDQPDADKDFAANFKILPDELKNSIRLDQALNGYTWENRKFREHLALIVRYEPAQDARADAAFATDVPDRPIDASTKEE